MDLVLLQIMVQSATDSSVRHRHGVQHKQRGRVSGASLLDSWVPSAKMVLGIPVYMRLYHILFQTLPSIASSRAALLAKIRDR